MTMYNFDPKENIDRIVDWIKIYFSDFKEETKAIIGISGGKDSTVCAALLAKALGADRVLGVIMPNGEQSDIEDAYTVCKLLNINYIEINIANACYEIESNVKKLGINSQVSTNIPPRIRMTTLYAVAASVGGRVCNTSNYSEISVGYSTKFGDNVGDFGLLRDYTATEVCRMGKVLAEELNLHSYLIEKAPADGLSGLTDEDNLGFTYEELDSYLRLSAIPEKTRTLKKIRDRISISGHKKIALPTPQCKYCKIL